MAGFSDRIELGHFGRIKDNPTVVLRVEFPKAEDRNRLPPYWRGTAFDYYDGSTWSKSRSKSRRRLKDPDLPGADTGGVVEQEIYLEPMESRVAFGLNKVQAIKIDTPPALDLPAWRRNFEIDDEGDLFYEQADQVAFRYTVHSAPERTFSRLTKMSLEGYRQLASMRARTMTRRYLQQPDGLSDRVRALGRRIIGDAQTVGQAIDRIESFLKDNYAYTLDLERDERFAPLEDFLFLQKKGHCEYFSTAMVILLRTQGIAARNVNGFYGGHWNSFGKYLAVSQGDAHSWVELLWPVEDCSGQGPCVYRQAWATRDPTPGSASRDQVSGLWSSMMQYTDSLRMRWYKHVIEYDLQQQVGFVLSVREVWRSLWNKDRSKQGPGGTGTSIDFRGAARWLLASLLALVLLVALSVAIWRRFSGRRGSAAQSVRRSHESARLYTELVSAYERLGINRTPSTTAREFLTMLRKQSAPDLSLATQIVAIYEQVRFGRSETVPADLKSLFTRIRSIGRQP
jgi:transglutaminase-like putative cysteine protease